MHGQHMEPITDKYLLIVGDSDTGQWTIIDQNTEEKPVRKSEQELVESEDVSPRLVIYTGDFVQV